MDKNEIYCFDCNKYFPNIDLFNQEHNKTINKVIGIKHDFLKPELTLQYISNLTKKIKSLSEELEKKDQQIKEFSKRLELVEDLNKGFFVECNAQIRNGKNVIKNIGTCFLNFISRNINFRIECNKDILNKDKIKFNIEIIFPFRKAKTKQCYVERLFGCVSSKEIMDYEGNSVIIFDGYSSFVKQNNSIISINLLKNYETQGFFEKKKINVVINGTLIFDSLLSTNDKPIILFNVNKKKFLCYEKNWKFIDNFILDDAPGIINERCLISLLIIDDKDDNYERKIIIKGKHNYLGYKSNSTNNENEAILDMVYYNKAYGVIKIAKNGNYLSLDENGNIIFNKEENYYLLCNID